MPDWDEIAKISMKICQEFASVTGVYPTLRELFYSLVSRKLIPDTKSSYKTLSRVLSELRYRGDFPFEYIRDVERKNEYIEKPEWYPEEVDMETLKKMIMNYISSLSSYSINPWVDQRKRIIVVVEKASQYELIKSIVQKVFPFGVYNIRHTKGYDSATDIKEIANLVRTISNNYDPVLLLFGDFDPSGEDIIRDFVTRVRRLSERSFTWEKVAVTLEQIEKYNLPHRPEDEKSVEKLKRDPRFKSWKYGLFKVELEALFNPEMISIAEEIVKKAIEKHFDWDTYREKTEPRMKKAEEKSKSIRANMINKVQKLFEGK